MSPSSPQNIDQESGHHKKQSFKSRAFDPFTTSFQKLIGSKIRSKPSRVVEQDIVATLQDAHHFNISGNPRFVNIGQQINNRGTHGLDTLEKFVSFSALHDSSAQDPERCCHPGTREWVLDQMRNWTDDPTRPERILWLHGPAGVGKSAIVQTVSYSYGRDEVGATFFFSRSDPIRNDGNRLFPTLAWQLTLSVPTVKDLVTSSLEDYPDLPRKAIEAQFERLIAQPFLMISGGESTTPASVRVIIIDGLDECSDVKLQQRILKLIGNAVADPRFPLRFVISSRTEAHIEDFFSQFQYPTLQIDLANIDAAHHDIEIYLKFEFTRIAVEQELDPKVWPGQRIIDRLVSKSSGQFIYAFTVIKYIGTEYESAVERLNIILGLKSRVGKSPFLELDALYTEILQRQPDKFFLKEFLLVLVARSMLADVGNMDLHEDDAMLLGLDNKQLHRKLRGMHSLLKSKPFIDVYHKSFLDFIIDPSRSGEYYISMDFVNRGYMQLITDKLVQAASNAIEQIDSHEGDHFKPRFAGVIKRHRFPIKLSLDDLEDILRPLSTIQEKLIQLPNMSVPWKPRACEECWTFYMIDDLFLRLTVSRGRVQSQESKYVGLRPLTAIEEWQTIPQLDPGACLSLLLAKLKGEDVSLNVHTIGLVRALVHFDPTETAMRIRSITDAENLVELILCLNKNQCFNSWFGPAAHNATRLALAIFGRVPVFPRSLFMNSADLNIYEDSYQGKAVSVWNSVGSLQPEYFDAFLWGNISHSNVAPLFGMCPDLMSNRLISPPQENGTVGEWRKSRFPSVSQIQQIVFEVAKVIQYLHSLDIVLRFGFTLHHVFLDCDNHAKVNFFGFRPNPDMRVEYEGDWYFITLTAIDIYAFGLFFYGVLFDQFDDDATIELRPSEPEIPDNVWELIQWCCANDPKERPTMDRVVQELESWISLS